METGDELVIARTGNCTCPVAMLERYMRRTSMCWNDQRYLFRPIQRTKNGEVLRQSGKISYTCMRELFRKKIADLGLPPCNFGLHSLRSGGATAAAGAKVPDRLFKRHGRWKSENAKDGYVKDEIQTRLTVSRSLGLYSLSSKTPSLITPIIVGQPLRWHNTMWLLSCMCGFRECMMWEGMILSSRRATHVCRSTGRGIKSCQIASVHTRTCIITYRGFKCLLPLASSLASHLG